MFHLSTDVFYRFYVLHLTWDELEITRSLVFSEIFKLFWSVNVHVSSFEIVEKCKIPIIVEGIN